MPARTLASNIVSITNITNVNDRVASRAKKQGARVVRREHYHSLSSNSSKGNNTSIISKVPLCRYVSDVRLPCGMTVFVHSCTELLLMLTDILRNHSTFQKMVVRSSVQHPTTQQKKTITIGSRLVSQCDVVA
eukprot:Lithocolla_globosa_v1_NODE_2822_length_1858_cov_4.186356.p2 type:complete len:133 gc:universal NODE_2822_length_1858_cov_4.186356:535-137(-)